MLLVALVFRLLLESHRDLRSLFGDPTGCGIGIQLLLFFWGRGSMFQSTALTKLLLNTWVSFFFSNCSTSSFSVGLVVLANDLCT